MKPKLSNRDSDVLGMIVADYIASASPVGSGSISSKFHPHLSSATIRNIMADLTRLGFLTQPHTSAGRIPTQYGLRFFVDSLLKFSSLSENEEGNIRSRFSNKDRELKPLLEEASKTLATFTHCVSLVAAPALNDVIFKQIEFIRLSSNRLLGIFVGQDGRVENRVIDVSDDFTISEIEKINNYCNSAFLGLTLDRARAKVFAELEQHRDEYDNLITKAFLFASYFFEKLPKSEIMIDGTSNLVDAKAKEVGRLKDLLKLLEEKEHLLKLLDNTKNSEGIKIFIGSEAGYSEMEDMSVVTAPYKNGEKVVGTLGVIGPTWMNYSKMVSVVDFTSKIVSDILSVKE